MKEINFLIKESIPTIQDRNIIHFILNDKDRPKWSIALENHLKENQIDLDMNNRYENQRKLMTKDKKHLKFINFISSIEGIKVDLASGPSGYFASMLDKLTDNDIFIATDACPSIINAHSVACKKDNFFVFDLDLEKDLPFKDESIDVFCANLLNNVNSYDELINEIYRCLKHGGRFAVIEIFFEHGCETYKYLKSQNAIWSSFETFIDFCESIRFKYIDSDILQTRTGKIAEGDLLPLNDKDKSTERAVYFEKY